MSRWIVAAALVATLAGNAGAAERRDKAKAPPSPPPRLPPAAATCSGTYSGAARGVFDCRVTAVYRAASRRSQLIIEVADDQEVRGDAQKLIPAQVEWTGDVTLGRRAASEPAVTSAMSSLQVASPPDTYEYVAAKAWRAYPVDQGQVVVTITKVAPGPIVDGAQRYEVHGTLSTVLLPFPAQGGGSGTVKTKLVF